MGGERMAGCQNVVQTIFRAGRKEVRPLLLLVAVEHTKSSRFVQARVAITLFPTLRSTITMKRLGSASIWTSSIPPWSRMVRLIHLNGISKVDKSMFTSELLFLLTFTPPDGKWYLRQYGYVPFAVLDVSSTGRQTREGSRTLEVGGEGIFLLKTLPSSLTLFHKYAFEDFGIRQVAQLLGKADDVAKYTQRSLVRSSPVYPFLFSWQDLVISQCLGPFCSQRRLQRCEWHGPFCFRILKFDSGFAQKRYSNGTFFYTDPIDCSSNDKDNTRECSLQGDNVVGFYESSSWEYSWYVHQPELTMAVWTVTLRYAPHDTAHLIELMGGNVSVAVLKNVRYVGLMRQLGNLCQSTWPLLQCQPLFLSTIPHGIDYTRLDIIFLETNRLSKCVLLLL